MTPNNDILGRETPGQTLCVSALMAAALGLPLADIADAVDQGFHVARTWAEYDRLLDLFDRHVCPFEPHVCPFEPEGPWADDDPAPPISERSSRRHRGERKGEIQALLARDGRASVESALRNVTARKTSDWRRWFKVCDQCAAPFEAKRADARYCSDRCRVAARRDRR